MAQKSRILLVDDNESIISTMTDILEESGYHIRSALTGEEGLQCLEQEPYDVVLLDVKMSGMTGIEMLYKASNLYSGTKFIVMTAHTLEDFFFAAFSPEQFVINSQAGNDTAVTSRLMSAPEPLNLGVVIGDQESVFSDVASRSEFCVVDETNYLNNAASLEGEKGILVFAPDTPLMNSIIAVKNLIDRYPKSKSLLIVKFPLTAEESMLESSNGDVYSYMQKPLDIRFTLKFIEAYCSQKNTS